MSREHYYMSCVICIDHRENPSLGALDWFALVRNCISCLGTNREPIPLAEVIAHQRTIDLNG